MNFIYLSDPPLVSGLTEALAMWKKTMGWSGGGVVDYLCTLAYFSHYAFFLLEGRDCYKQGPRL